VRRDPTRAPAAMSMFVRSTPVSRADGRAASSGTIEGGAAASRPSRGADNGVAAAGDAVARLERRVQALEAWRREVEESTK